jgi:hypothetical protein
MPRARAYRALTYLYPPRFRRRYGDEMVRLFADRARDDGSWRTWRNALRDLTVSTPNEHWENFMSGSPRARLMTAVVATSAAAIVLLLVGVTILALVLLVVVAWQLYSISRVRGHRPAAYRWWKFAGGGLLLFATLFVVFAMPWPEEWRSVVPGEVAWSVAMLGFSLSLVLVITGLLLGAAQRWGRGDRGAPA